MQLTTARLILRPFVPGDFATCVAALNDYAVSRHLARVPFPYATSDVREFHAFVQTMGASSLFCAVALKQDPSVLRGLISYEWSEDHGNAEFGYWYDPAMWGKGYATEAGQAVVAHAFSVNRHPRLVSGYHLDNPASGRVLDKLGFRQIDTTSEYSQAQHREVPTRKLELTLEDWLSRNALQNTNRT